MRDFPVSLRDSLPLRRYLEISRQPAGSAFHTSQVSISFGETIDAAALRAAWEAVTQAHAALRCAFNAEGGLTEAARPGFAWKELDWQNTASEELGATWQALVDSDSAAPIAFDTAAPHRITLIRLPNGGSHALWSFHAALLDHASISTVLHRWLHTYDCLRSGAEAPRFDPPTSNAPSVEPEDAWKTAFERFSPPRPLIVLPLPRGNEPAGTRRSISHVFERPERAEFAAAAKNLGGDPRSLFGAAWAFVLARATASDDVLLLEPSRPQGGVGRLESFRLHRRKVDGHPTSGDLVRAFAADAPPSPLDPAAMAQALNLPEPALEPTGSFVFREHTLNDRLVLEMPRWMEADAQLIQNTPIPTTLRVVATDRPEIALDYDPARLSDTAARTLFEAFRGTLAAFAADPSLTLDTFALPGAPSEVEAPEVPSAFRSLVPQGIHEIFADAAAESPDAIAVEFGDEKLTFAQLNNAANQLARLLRKRGIEPGARVAIAMPRSPKWVTALLGALKAGAIIVPTRVEDTGADVRGWIVDSLPEGDERKPVVQMQADAGPLANEKSRGVQNETNPASDAIAWKSDSASVALSHEKLAAALQYRAALLALSPGDRVLQFAPTATFSAVEEALATLLSGATLVLRAEDRWPTRTAFQEFIQEKSITALSVPTAFWSQWTHYLSDLSLRAPSTLRIVVTTGELPAPNAAAAWRAAADQARWLHHTTAEIPGGPGLSAEFADDALWVAARLGEPGPATLARLVDSRGLIVPVGMPGNVEITSIHAQEAFKPLGIEAFASPEGAFYARSQLQAIVAGPSPEVLAEAIRHAAASHPGVFDAHVEHRLISARHEWCVWIVPQDSERGEPHDFRDWLAARLPAALRRIRALPRFPLDDAGGIDHAALIELLPEDAAAPSLRKGSDVEERFRQAISRALGGRRIELDEILTDGRTKPVVAKLLLEAVSREEPRVELADFTTGFSVRSLLRNVRSRRTGKDSPWTPLQPLRASGKLPPLVFIHDFDGTAKPFAGLVAHLGDDQPCYAITARGLVEPDACHSSIEEMARAYVEALRVFDASGPYRLAGYGFGGLVAFEMARQLTAANAQVALLVALATEPPAGNSPTGFLLGGWKRALPAFLGGKPAGEPNGRRRRTQDTPVFRANREAAGAYAPPQASLAAQIFAPEREFPSYSTVQRGWSACCRDARFYQVPCSGREMMDEPAVEAVARAITKLARSEALDTELET
ncbi:MAG: AMP-binding protein [Terrimicrobiaceae bacterium]|nr:AMP-binding protein [Terrimicrobiaceae bacterium]